MLPIQFRRSLTAMFLCLMFMVAVFSSHADEVIVHEDGNIIEKIKTGAAGVEIHLQSSRVFPVRALPAVLQIGSASFNRSYSPPDGDLHRLIFLLDPEVFAQLKSGVPMHVVYGKGETPGERWDFGVFNK